MAGIISREHISDIVQFMKYSDSPDENGIARGRAVITAAHLPSLRREQFSRRILLNQLFFKPKNLK